MSSVAIGALAIKGYKWSLTVKPDEPLDPYDKLLLSLEVCNKSLATTEDQISRIQKRLERLRICVSEEDLARMLNQYAGMGVDQLTNILEDCKSLHEVTAYQVAERKGSLDELQQDVVELLDRVDRLRDSSQKSSLATAKLDTEILNRGPAERHRRRTSWDIREMV